jgi:heme exporter protein D
MTAVMDFLRMGGYAAYVWPAYGLTAVVMLGLLIGTLRSLRARRRELEVLEGGGRARRARRERLDEEVDTTT